MPVLSRALQFVQRHREEALANAPLLYAVQSAAEVVFATLLAEVTVFPYEEAKAKTMRLQPSPESAVPA